MAQRRRPVIAARAVAAGTCSRAPSQRATKRPSAARYTQHHGRPSGKPSSFKRRISEPAGAIASSICQSVSSDQVRRGPRLVVHIASRRACRRPASAVCRVVLSLRCAATKPVCTVATNESPSGVTRASHALSFHDPLDTFAQSAKPNRAAAVTLACAFHHAAIKLTRAAWHASQRRAPAPAPSSPRTRQSAATGCVKCPMAATGGCRSGHRCCSLPNFTARPHKGPTKA